MPERARRRRVAHDRLVLIGLAPHEVSLARIAAAGAYEIVVAHDEWPDGSRQDAVYVTSLAWWEHVRTRSPADGTLHAQRCVLLVPAEPTPASRWRVADALPLAIPVFTHTLEAELLLARAILAVRHGTVADALRARLAHASAAPDLPTRALDAALALLPDERTVPRLARALHRSERTLRRHLQEARADLTPQEVLRWALLLHAAWDLTATGDPFDRMARRVAASDAANLRRMVRIMTGLSPRALIANGRDPVDRMLACWQERTAASPPRRPAAPPDDASCLDFVRVREHADHGPRAVADWYVPTRTDWSHNPSVAQRATSCDRKRRCFGRPSARAKRQPLHGEDRVPACPFALAEHARPIVVLVAAYPALRHVQSMTRLNSLTR